MCVVLLYMHSTQLPRQKSYDDSFFVPSQGIAGASRSEEFGLCRAGGKLSSRGVHVVNSSKHDCGDAVYVVLSSSSSSSSSLWLLAAVFVTVSLMLDSNWAARRV